MTRILAFETTGETGSVAALTDGGAVCERPLPPERRSAQTLASGLRDLLAEVGWRPDDVELIAVAGGPGSFTGLRVGVTTAKMLAYVIGCPVVAVNTLEAIASRAPRDFARVCVAMEAQRGELFVGRFVAAAGSHADAEGTQAADEWTQAEAPRADPSIERADAFLAGLAPGDGVTGPALETLADRLPAHARMAPRELWWPSAAAVGRLAWRDFKAGRRDDPFQLTPLYLRRTAAEDQWDRRTQA